MNIEARFRSWLQSRCNCGGIFDIDRRVRELEELKHKSQNPEIWKNPKEMQKLNREIAVHAKTCEQWNLINNKVEDLVVLLEMAEEESDEKSFQEAALEIEQLKKQVGELELKKLLDGPSDANSAFLSIHSGAGGTEACDWAQMLYRMYTRYAERAGYKMDVLEVTAGEEVGLKSITLNIQGPYAYGYLKAESGVHRLVRISPFDSNARRHTSFASVFAWPEIDDDIEVELKQEDIKTDTYRASGAGGQHINTTDSAVRLTHKPTGIVVQCQNQRSQHANRETAIKLLKAALYERELQERDRKRQEMNSQKKANKWGSQIRSYVMHPYSMVKDHRTSQETSQVQDVMNGDLNDFIFSYLRQKTEES